MLLLRLLIIPSLVLSFSANAGSWEQRRNNLNKAVVYDNFRVFYALSGTDQLPENRQTDFNHNGVPDFIDKIGRILTKSNSFFSNEVKLTPPLQSSRYKGKALYIDVNILNFSNNIKGPRNGIAYDGTPKFNRSLTGQASVNVLTIDISGSVNLQTNTIEHELFHLYQNGYTYFKNRWYTEGTARWSELVIKGRIGKGGKLPTTKFDKEILFKKSYDANTFWNELILITDKKDLGKSFIKQLLEELNYADDLAANERGITNINWKESEQRSINNNFYIWQAINMVVDKFPRAEKLKSMHLL